MDLLVEIAGWVGTVVLLVAYALVSRGVLAGHGARYQALNVAGSLLLGVNSLVHGAWPSVGINGVWFVIGVATLTAAARRRGTAAPPPS